jgi:glucose uptake protein GlcU
MLAFLFKFFIIITLTCGVPLSFLVVNYEDFDFTQLDKIFVGTAIALIIGGIIFGVYAFTMYNDKNSWNNGACPKDGTSWCLKNVDRGKFYYSCSNCNNIISLDFTPDELNSFFDN